MTDDEYKARRSHLRSINPQTADCPPADELAALEEQFVEQLTAEKMENLFDDAHRIQEYILESDYEDTNFQLVCVGMGAILRGDKPNVLAAFRQVLKAFLQLQTAKEAQAYVESL